MGPEAGPKTGSETGDGSPVPKKGSVRWQPEKGRPTPYSWSRSPLGRGTGTDGFGTWRWTERARPGITNWPEEQESVRRQEGSQKSLHQQRETDSVQQDSLRAGL